MNRDVEVSVDRRTAADMPALKPTAKARIVSNTFLPFNPVIVTQTLLDESVGRSHMTRVTQVIAPMRRTRLGCLLQKTARCTRVQANLPEVPERGKTMYAMPPQTINQRRNQ